MSKNTLLLFLLWILLGIGFYLIADHKLNPNKIHQFSNNSSVTLQRSLDGHYRTEALINGEKVYVLVDTGATGVAISQKIAHQLGLKSHHAVNSSTANGNTVVYMTRLDEIKIGGVIAHHVSAVISPGLEGDVLLGMSFLGRMDVRLFKNEMTIKQIESDAH